MERSGQMTFLDFFAGVGGFRRGLELAGHKCIGFCEWDKFAAASYTSMHLITAEQRTYLATLDLKTRQKEILKDEYRNGEWFSNDIRSVDAGSIPRADCWCFGAPCQDFSIAGKRAGLDGDRSSLVREVFRICREIREEDRPEWLIYENVKGMLSSNRGFDFLGILSEMGGVGYDIEWFNFNSKYHGVPQNRERIYTVGHLRAKGSAKIFPIKGSNGENRVQQEVSIIGHRDGFRRNTQVFSADGVTEALDTADGGGRGHHVAIPVTIGYDNGMQELSDGIAPTLMARDYKGVNFRDLGGVAQGVSVQRQTGTAVAIPVLTPDRVEKRQNGRRFKEDGDPSFTLTAQDIHGVAVGVPVENPDPESEHPGMYVRFAEDLVVWAVWYEKYQCYIAIRKLTPRECFRLQGWDDEYFERAEFVNSDSQLYKQAGNGVTVNVVYEIGKAIKEHEYNQTKGGRT